MKRTILLASEFSRFPGGRFVEDGPFSGQQFREDFLIPALRENDQVEIIFDGVAGYAASFLEESFGGAVVAFNKNYNLVKSKLIITIADDPDLPAIIDQYMQKAAK
jgi:STAS-like domain of unknown function (DUF4325)